MKKRLSILLALLMLFTCLGGTYAAAEEVTGAGNGEDLSLVLTEAEDAEQGEGGAVEALKYYKYLEQYQSIPNASKDDAIVIAGGDFSGHTEAADAKKVDFTQETIDAIKEEYNDRQMDFSQENEAEMYRTNVLKWESQEGSVTWTFDVKKAGMYQLDMEYLAMYYTQKNIELSLKIDGAHPFLEADEFAFSRSFNDVTEEDGRFSKDKQGNELTPQYRHMARWQTGSFSDFEGMQTMPFKFYLSAGTHTIELGAIREPLYIAKLMLVQPDELVNYEDIAPSKEQLDATKDVFEKVQGENVVGKSDPSARPSTDYSSPATEPYNPFAATMNSLGGEAWKYSGQWVEWKVNVPKDGYYKLGVKFKQSFVRGLFTSRQILIDGEVPCEELQSVRFTYDSGWQNIEIGKSADEPYYFYLTEGDHIIRMNPTLNELSEVLNSIAESQENLNALYRKIIMITGTNPDPYMDYDLVRDIPNLINTLESEANLLYSHAANLEQVIGKTGSTAATIYTMADQLKEFAERPSRIAKNLATYKENLSALSSWLLTIKEQPLQIDYLYVASADQDAPKATAEWYEEIWHLFVQLYASYTMDYATIGDDDAEGITVWIYGGRDQANLVKRLVDEKFYKETQIPVNVQLVTVGLINAIMAGYAPDVSLSGDAINLGLRGALQSLEGLEGFDEVRTWFPDTAFDGFEIEGHYYALPSTLTYDMMFYREDVLADMGLEVPETWEDLFVIAPILQHNNMEIGLPGQTVFDMLFTQSGGVYYNEDRSKLQINNDLGYKAFTTWVSYYAEYGFSLYKDDYNRFRTGEMPITITEYTMYNKLKVAAPEISGLWTVAPIPGTRNEETGEISRTQCGAIGGCVMPKAAVKDNPKALANAWEFMKWWVSADTQASYGNDIEALLGTAARYTPANIEAFADLAWSKSEVEIFATQRKDVLIRPGAPGDYYVSRNIQNAFSATYLRGEDAREMLTYWTNETNREIERKREEFGLDDGTWEG